MNTKNAIENALHQLQGLATDNGVSRTTRQEVLHKLEQLMERDAMNAVNAFIEIKEQVKEHSRKENAGKVPRTITFAISTIAKVLDGKLVMIHGNVKDKDVPVARASQCLRTRLKKSGWSTFNSRTVPFNDREWNAFLATVKTVEVTKNHKHCTNCAVLERRIKELEERISELSKERNSRSRNAS